MSTTPNAAPTAAPTMDAAPLPAFQAFQRDFAARIRNPRGAARPEGVPARRMRAYEELLYANLCSFLDACFPVARRLLGPRRWGRLTRHYFVAGAPRTPLFREIPKEFVEWFATAEAAAARRDTLPPWLAELLHYEWIELAVDVMDVERPAATAVDAAGDLIVGRPVLNPALRVLAYAWPVHRIGPGCRPRKPQPVHLVVVRDADHQVRFIEINAVTAHLLAQLAGADTNRANTPSGEVACLAVAAALQHPAPAEVVAFGATLLNDLRRADVVLGTWK